MANLLQLTSEQVTYDPDHLLDTLLKRLDLKNDKALAARLDISAPVISKIRHRILPVGSTILIRMHEISDISIKELRALMGDHRARFMVSDDQFCRE
jgi:hypothetical protein